MDKPKFEFSIIQLMNRLGEQAPEWDSVTRCPNGKSERLGKLRTNEYTLRIVEDGKSELVHLWVYVEPAENNTHLITADVTIGHNARRMTIENTLCDEPVTGFIYQAISVFIKEMYKHRADHKPEGPKPKTKLEVAAEKLADASNGIQAEIDKASQKIDTEQPEKQDTRPKLSLAREINDEWIDSHPTLTFAEQVKLAEVIISTPDEASKRDRDQLQKYLSYLFAEELHEKCIANGDFRIRGDAYVSSQPNNPETRKYWKRYVLTYPGIVYEAYMLEATKLSTANFKSYVLLALNMKDGHVRDCLLRAFTVSADTGINPSGPMCYLIVKSGNELDYLTFNTSEPINIALANISYAEITHDAVLEWFWNGWGESAQTPAVVDHSEDTIASNTTDKDANADYKWVKHVGGDNILVPTETVKGFIKNLFSSLVEPGLPANKDPEKIRWHIFYGVYQTNQYIGFTEYTFAGEAVDWVFFRNPALDKYNWTGYACLIMFQSGKYVDTYVEFSVDPDNLITYGESHHTRIEDHRFKIDTESGGTHYPTMTVLLDLCYDYILEQAKATESRDAQISKPLWVNSTAGETEMVDDDVLHEELTKTMADKLYQKKITSSLGQVVKSDGVPGDDYWRVYDIVEADQTYKTFMLRTPSFDAGAGLGYTFLIVGIVDNIVRSGLIEQVRVYKHEGVVVEKILSVGALRNGRLCVIPGWRTDTHQELLDAKKSLTDVLGWFRASYGEEE